MKYYLIICICLFTNIAISQIDKTVPVISSQPTWLIQVPPVSYEPYGIDAVVSVGAFDNIKINTLPGLSEPHIAVNPRNPLNFVAGDNRSVVSATNIHVTTDGGHNWTYSVTGVNGGDPVFAFDSLGNVFYSVLNPSFNGVRIYRSTNGGLNWTNLGNTFTLTGTDKQWIACDQTAGANSNNIYMAFTNFQTGATIRFSRSTNTGVTWSAPIAISNTDTINQGSSVAVGPDGKVYVVWYSAAGSSFSVSNNGGSSFTSPVTCAAYTPAGVFHAASRRLVLKGNIRVMSFPQLVADLSYTSTRGNLYVTFSANPAGSDNADVYIVRSTNSGQTWSTPSRLNDDVTACDQWMPTISVDLQGRVWAMWYDSRNDAANIYTEAYATVSTNGGQTFLPNFKLSNQNFHPNNVGINQGDHYYIGDYHSIAGSTVTLPIWMDGRESQRDNYTVQLPDFGLTFNKQKDSLAPGGIRTNYINTPLMGPYSGTVDFTATITPVPTQGNISISWPNTSSLNINGTPNSLPIRYTVTGAVPEGTYTINVTGIEQANVKRTHTRSFDLTVSSLVGISENEHQPFQYKLYQNYPNPFNPETSIALDIKEQGYIKLLVYNSLGQIVSELINEKLSAGKHIVKFNGENYASGVYYYKLLAGNEVQMRKMLLLK